MSIFYQAKCFAADFNWWRYVRINETMTNHGLNKTSLEKVTPWCVNYLCSVTVAAVVFSIAIPFASFLSLMVFLYCVCKENTWYHCLTFENNKSFHLLGDLIKSSIKIKGTLGESFISIFIQLGFWYRRINNRTALVAEQICIDFLSNVWKERKRWVTTS